MNVNHSFWKLTERSNYAKAERHILTILVFLSSVFSFCSRLALQDVQSCISSGLIFKRHRNKVLCSWLDEVDDLERACVTLWGSGGQSSWKFDIQKKVKKKRADWGKGNKRLELCFMMPSLSVDIITPPLTVCLAIVCPLSHYHPHVADIQRRSPQNNCLNLISCGLIRSVMGS